MADAFGVPAGSILQFDVHMGSCGATVPSSGDMTIEYANSLGNFGSEVRLISTFAPVLD